VLDALKPLPPAMAIPGGGTTSAIPPAPTAQ
jgi:hypothetical protein